MAVAVGMMGLGLGTTARAQVTAPTSLTVVPSTSFSTTLSWSLPPGADHVQVLRDGRLLDEFPSGAGTTYLDYLLWQSTAYTYEVKVFDVGGAVLSDDTAGVTTPAQTGSFPRLYAATSFWNKAIGKNATTDPNSVAIIATSISAYSGVSTFNDSDAWGIPIAYANPQSEMYSVACTQYDCQFPMSYRIPRYAKANTQLDAHLTVMDPGQPPDSTELDMWHASYDPVADAWSAGSRYDNDAFGWGANCALHAHCGGAVAAGFSAMGGVIRPEEIAQGHIDHALAMGSPYTRKGVIACPGTNAWVTGGYDDPNAVPLGAHIQLDKRFNVNAQPWPEWEKTIARALQRYGAYMVDNAGSLEVRAEATLDRGYNAWAKVGIPNSWPGTPSLADIPWSMMRVLKIQFC